MKTNKPKTKTKKAVKPLKAENKSAKKPKKAATVKTKKDVIKVYKVKPAAKPKKVAKAVTAKKKTITKVKPSPTKARKVPAKKEPVKKTGEKTKAPARKTLSKKPLKKQVEKKFGRIAPQKTKKTPIKTGKIAAKKTTVKAKTVIAKKPAVKKRPTKTKTSVEVKAKSRAKTVEKKKEPSFKIKPLKQIAVPTKKLSVKERVVKQQPEESSKKPEKTKLKIFLPEKDQVDEIIEVVLYQGLQDEYGENDFFIMPIDPNYIFVNWEITKEAFLKGRGTLNIRAYDITGLIFDSSNFNKFFDININNRTGSGFFEINMPGCDVIMEIGFLHHDGRFKPVIRSNRVSIPSLMTFDELGIVQKLYEAGVPVGY